MSALLAATIGSVAGLLCGTVIEALMNVTLTEALFRILVLTVCSGFMAALFVWLDQGLEHAQPHDEAHHQ